MALTDEQRQSRNAYMREWKRKNKGKVNAINRAVKAKNPDRYKEINRRSIAKRRKEEPEIARYNYRKERLANPALYLWKHAKRRAAAKGLAFDLELDDIIVPTHCPVLGYKLEWGVGQKASSNTHSPSLDRFDPSKGYVKGNVDVISNRANHLKNNATLEEIEALVAYMRRRGAA